MAETTLNKLELGRSARVLCVSGNCASRLNDLGFVPGAQVTPLCRAALGDPKAYSILGAVIALRGNDSAAVTVRYD